MSTTVRWNVAVSPEIDQSVRLFMAAQGGGRKGDLSRFIEEAVRAHLLERAADQAKAAASGLPAQQLEDLIDEAVDWARRAGVAQAERPAVPAVAGAATDAGARTRRKAG
jgi:hypothetical protein